MVRCSSARIKKADEPKKAVRSNDVAEPFRPRLGGRRTPVIRHILFRSSYSCFPVWPHLQLFGQDTLAFRYHAGPDHSFREGSASSWEASDQEMISNLALPALTDFRAKGCFEKATAASARCDEKGTPVARSRLPFRGRFQKLQVHKYRISCP